MTLGKGGRGFFIVPPNPGASDSVCYFILVVHITPESNLEIITGDTLQKDSINFSVPDPALQNFGDSLFTTAKLVEAPAQLISCGAFNRWKHSVSASRGSTTAFSTK